MKIQLLVLAILLMPFFTIAQTAHAGLQVNDKSTDFTPIDEQRQKQLKRLEDSLIFIKNKSAGPVAISPERDVNLTPSLSKGEGVAFRFSNVS